MSGPPLARSSVEWLGVVAAPAAWTAQLTIGYGVEEAACSPGAAAQTIWDLSPELLLWVLTGVCAAVAAVGLVAALATRRAAVRAAEADPRGRHAFMGLAGAISSGVFVLLILSAPVFLAAFDSCVPG